MALLAEELVEEWLNRQGYFTIRGVKLGVHEIDLIAVRLTAGGVECRHIEVQSSVRPMSYITRVPIEVQKRTGRRAGSAKPRDDGELRQGVREWIQKKFDHPAKRRLLNALAPGPWSRELVVHVVRHEEEVSAIRDAGILVRRLVDIVADLKRGEMLIEGASGGPLVDLVAMAAGEVVDDAPVDGNGEMGEGGRG